MENFWSISIGCELCRNCVCSFDESAERQQIQRKKMQKRGIGKNETDNGKYIFLNSNFEF